MRFKLLFMLLTTLTVICTEVFAQDVPPSPHQETPHSEVPGDSTNELAKYVAINVEIKELKESGLILKEASEKLSVSLAQVSENINDLSPEQLVLINSLADKVDGIADKLSLALKELPNTLDKAQKPSAKIVKNALQQVKAETIDPVTASISTWILITLGGLSILGIALLSVSAYCIKHVGKIGMAVKDIADGYRIIPVEQLQNDPVQNQPIQNKQVDKKQVKSNQVPKEQIDVQKDAAE